MIRIISGKFKGRKLAVGKERVGFRPTKDRVKESLFSILGTMENKIVIDLFAGTGNLGFEALSRGAKKCIFIEKDRKQSEMIKSNADLLGISDKCIIHSFDAITFLKKNEINCDIIFADPPYQFLRTEQLFELFNKISNLEIIYESSKRFKFPEFILEKIKSEKIYGDTKLTFLEV